MATKPTKNAKPKAAAPKPKAAPPVMGLAAGGEPHALTSPAIADLDLVDYAQAASEKLLADFPQVVFTSGRRSADQQANAMAGNIAVNRKWIQETYLVNPQSTSLQAWVDSHPEAATKAQIAAGLIGIMSTWTDP